MTLTDEIEAILPETIAALAHLRSKELEELEQRLTQLANGHPPGSVTATRELQLKMDHLAGCLSVTAANMRVLRRVLDRNAEVKWAR